nr:MAG TPA: hypothetical protein [Caudoviricetes sp.]
MNDALHDPCRSPKQHALRRVEPSDWLARIRADGGHALLALCDPRR